MIVYPTRPKQANVITAMTMKFSMTILARKQLKTEIRTEKTVESMFSPSKFIVFSYSYPLKLDSAICIA
jgi:hypothetical protein